MNNQPPLTLDFAWNGDLRFAGRAGDIELTLDSEAKAGPSPVQALAFGLGACMAIDLVEILRKGRHPVNDVRVRLIAHRDLESPRRVLRVDLHFLVTGGATATQVERAIALSREKYCSVWHSMRQDIELNITHEESGD